MLSQLQRFLEGGLRLIQLTQAVLNPGDLEQALGKHRGPWVGPATYPRHQSLPDLAGPGTITALSGSGGLL